MASPNDRLSGRPPLHRQSVEDARPIVHDSCGCVFCDLDLEPRLLDGELVHDHEPAKRVFGHIPCTRNTPQT